MGTLHAFTLDKTEADRAQDWFPCLSNNTLSLDKQLARRLASDNVNLSIADITCLLRWYNNIPQGFVSMEDSKLANKLCGSIDWLLR